MGGDGLSQAEVDNLLSAMDGGDSKDSVSAEGKDAGLSASSRTEEKATIHDFKSPRRVDKEQMRALRTMHEGFGRNFGEALSALLRTIVEVKLTSVDQLTYSEFVFSLENPTCFNLVNAKPLEGQMILDINPSILFPIIDRLLGGTISANAPTRRPLTEIELRLVSRITDLFLNETQHTWENVLSLELEVDRVESNPQLVHIIPAGEMIVLFSFELTLGDTRGTIKLCIPVHSIERIGKQLSANSQASHGNRPTITGSMQQMSNRIADAPVEVVVELAETRITTSDLINLRVGDIIASDKDVRHPLLVYVEGIPKFRAAPGRFEGRKAIQILSSVEHAYLAEPKRCPAEGADEPEPAS